MTLGPVSSTPAELQAWQSALHLELGRPVDQDRAAGVLQALQERIRTPKGCRPLTLQQQLRCITPGDIYEFMRAAGLDESQIRRSHLRQAQAAAMASLSTLPTALLGTCLSSCIHASFPENDIARLIGFILNVAVLAVTPLANSLLMLPFSARADQWRSENYVVRLNRAKITDRFSKSQLAGQLRARVADFQATHAAMKAFIGLDADAHHRRPLPEDRAQTLCVLRAAHRRAVLALEQLLPDVHAKQAADTRVYLENRYQQMARYPKLVLAPVGQLLRAARWISAWGSAAFQIGASVGTSVVQSWFAGCDDAARQRFTLQYQMLQDPPLTPAGEARLARNQPLRADDVDAGRLRACFTGPAEARALLIAACLRARPGPEDADAAADLAQLESRTLAELALDGPAARLLEPGRRCDPLLWADISARFQRRGEISTQFCKFLGQQWQLLIGPGYYVLVPKLLNLAAGGKPPLPGMVACAALAALMGLAGCQAHPEVVVERNEMQLRIDQAEAGPGFVDFLRHAGVALVALPRQVQQRRSLEQAVDAALDCLLQQAQLDERLKIFGAEPVFHDALSAP